ncbi:MAG: hypothetical protein MZU84_06465, partial [Sphingobacterium sp.]|nr:hypothetical protein [Sphingobacterium sp.]
SRIFHAKQMTTNGIDSIRAKGRIIVLVQACIHPGESEGKDAGLMLMREPGFPNGHDNQAGRVARSPLCSLHPDLQCGRP